jgi:REP element-mobilizing transposase RayT
MARPVRIEYPGAVYHVVCRGNNRQAVFRDDHDRKRYLEKLTLYCQEKDVELLCYTLLTNHVHLVLETPQGNLSKMMQAFQTSYTVYFNKRHGRTGHVFEQRYKAFLVDRDNYLLEVSRYVHLNAVAARLVERPDKYRWSSYASYLKGKGIPASVVTSKPANGGQVKTGQRNEPKTVLFYLWPISRNVPTQLQRRDPPDFREGTHPITSGAQLS